MFEILKKNIKATLKYLYKITREEKQASKRVKTVYYIVKVVVMFLGQPWTTWLCS